MLYQEKPNPGNRYARHKQQEIDFHERAKQLNLSSEAKRKLAVKHGMYVHLVQLPLT